MPPATCGHAQTRQLDCPICPMAKVTIMSLSSQVMPPRAKGKNKATNAGLPSSRLRERTFTRYDEELAAEKDGEDALLEQAAVHGLALLACVSRAMSPMRIIRSARRLWFL